MKSSAGANQQFDACTQLDPHTGKLTVYYDGACPLCRREIDFYRRRSRTAPVEWVDAAANEAELLAPDLKRIDALARFHVRLPDGTLASGARGFGELWSVTPGFGWLGKLARIRPAQLALEAAYRLFLKVRPTAQRIAAKADAAPVAAPAYPRWLERELRSDHAGETGAVAIYRGILAMNRRADVRRFAHRHLQTEERHLAALRELAPASRRSTGGGGEAGSWVRAR